jgi:hypothetical protein
MSQILTSSFLERGIFESSSSPLVEVKHPILDCNIVSRMQFSFATTIFASILPLNVEKNHFKSPTPVLILNDFCKLRIFCCRLCGNLITSYFNSCTNYMISLQRLPIVSKSRSSPFLEAFL